MRNIITILGSSNLDYGIRLPRLPGEGESVAGGHFFHSFGGKGANQAVAVSRAGYKARFMTALGPEATNDAMLDSFRSHGLELSHIYRDRTIHTGTAVIMVGEEGKNYLGVDVGANHCLSPNWVREHEIALTDCARLVLQLEIPIEVNAAAIQIARSHGVPIQLNFAPYDPQATELLKDIDCLIVNEVEAGQLSGQAVLDPESALEAIRHLRMLGPKTVIITLGHQGVVAGEDDDFFHEPALPVNVVDTTAAGDTFCGYLAVFIANGTPLPEAVRWANRAAALAVTKPGAQDSIPWFYAVDSRF